MTTTPINQHDEVRLSAIFTNLVGVLTDPTTVLFSIQRFAPAPADTEVTYTYGVNIELVRDSVGAYHVDYVLPTGGTWSYRFAGEGAVTKSSQSEFYCAPANPA